MNIIDHAVLRLSFWRLDKPDWLCALSGSLIDAIEWCERVIYCHHNARVLCETEYRLMCVLDHATGGQLSSPHYSKETMYAAISENIARHVQEAVDEALEEYQADLPGEEPAVEPKVGPQITRCVLTVEAPR